MKPDSKETLAGALDLTAAAEIHRDLAPAHLVEHAIRRGEAWLASSGALVAETGRHTGRSPRDRFIVDEPGVHDTVAWGVVNQPLSEEHFARLESKVAAALEGRELFVQDLSCGAHPDHHLNIRVITGHAWHSLFARNMFRPPATPGAEPDFTVIDLPDLLADPERDGTNSGTFIVLNFARRLVLIGGTHYAGEIKKSIFTVMNQILPERGVLPMHCSANIGPDGDTAIFFGLSGTGKTTLSADARRVLIGDDEHGWGPDGVFNFEGGCYAKVIGLRAEAEPEIFAASSRFGAVLENVVTDPLTGEPDFDDGHLTENTRSSYPLDFIPNACADGTGGHPRAVVMLTADAFGVMPPISRLSPEQAMYHFLSGYTARVAGTEQGVTEPKAAFSPCFGAPFMPRDPCIYAALLRDLVRKHGTRCWLVNTGWIGGAYGTGRRIELRVTRAMIDAALAGQLDDVPTVRHAQFGLDIPTACPGVDPALLDPRALWSDPAAYDARAADLMRMFEDNFRKFDNVEDIHAAA